MNIPVFLVRARQVLIIQTAFLFIVGLGTRGKITLQEDRINADADDGEYAERKQAEVWIETFRVEWLSDFCLRNMITSLTTVQTILYLRTIRNIYF